MAVEGLARGHRYTYDVVPSGEAVRFQTADSVANGTDGVLVIEAYGFE